MNKNFRKIKNLFWKLPFSPQVKEKMRNKYATIKDEMLNKNSSIEISNQINKSDYIYQILNVPNQKSDDYVEFKNYYNEKHKTHIIAYYLTQFHPNIQNDEWWGKGVTEWTNVSKAVPQYVGHYQPRLPGELGYYDLRLKENFSRQIELALNYGVEAFCFYYYWFDGQRLLEKPLNLFLKNDDLKIKFCYCWANENWTKKFTGTNSDILMKIGESEESCIRFITTILDDFCDDRYYNINGKPILLIYRPSNIPNNKHVLSEWRRIVKQEKHKDIYIIAVQEKGDTRDWCSEGYDAETEFQPKRVSTVAKDITSDIKFMNNNYKGTVFDYEDLVVNKKYKIIENYNKKVYPAVMPMWDNTARKNNFGIIYHGATPKLYGRWLDDAITQVENNQKVDEKLVFINAWNEWGEGTYLEPDRMNGYAYLEETYNVLRKHDI